MNNTELEAAFPGICRAIEADVLRIVGFCLAKRTDDAGRLAASLLEYVENLRIQHEMTKEVAAPEEDRYDLRSLPFPNDPVDRES